MARETSQLRVTVGAAQKCVGANAVKWFRVLVGGEHCRIDVSGVQRYMGFFVTRFVEAATPDLARTYAIAAVRADARLDGLILNDDDDPPTLFADEVDEVSGLDVPDVEPGFVLFQDEARSAGSGISGPPYLVIREGVSFWVESRPLSDWTATPQALDEGCFRNARIYDANGYLWQIDRAEFKLQPSFVNMAFPWRQLPLRIDIGSGARHELLDVLAELAAILESDSSFLDGLDGDPREILECLTRATTPTELIHCAERCV